MAPYGRRNFFLKAPPHWWCRVPRRPTQVPIDHCGIRNPPPFPLTRALLDFGTCDLPFSNQPPYGENRSGPPGNHPRSGLEMTSPEETTEPLNARAQEAEGKEARSPFMSDKRSHRKRDGRDRAIYPASQSQREHDPEAPAARTWPCSHHS